MRDNHLVAKPQVVSLEGHAPARYRARLWAGTMVLGASWRTGCLRQRRRIPRPVRRTSGPARRRGVGQTKRKRRSRKTPGQCAPAGDRPENFAAVARSERAVGICGVRLERKNAFVLPGGKVGFYKGLIDFVDNDDQIAAVMGHEAGHVVARHAALRAGQQSATSLGVALGGAVLLGGVQIEQRPAGQWSWRPRAPAPRSASPAVQPQQRTRSRQARRRLHAHRRLTT